VLILHGPNGRSDSVADISAATLPDDVAWIDLLKADAAEIAFVERATGLTVPSFEELSEIETSSRIYTMNGVLYLSTPMVSRADSGEPVSSPLGFVLSPRLLVTVRFEASTVFKSLHERAGTQDVVHPSSTGIFVGLMEALVDRMADVLERVGAELETVSHRVFRDDETGARRRPAHADADLRVILRSVGRAGNLASKIRDSLLGTGRIVHYVRSLNLDWFPAEVKPHLDTLRQDIASLSDYHSYLTNKVQFLLDATLGLINIEQNNIIKVLTIVSVVGVPPTLVASMYGMNFKNMPELGWTYGYVWGLGLILVSAIGPLFWFKLRGWL
jgi:magnesium transporter